MTGLGESRAEGAGCFVNHKAKQCIFKMERLFPFPTSPYSSIHHRHAEFTLPSGGKMRNIEKFKGIGRARSQSQARSPQWLLPKSPLHLASNKPSRGLSLAVIYQIWPKDPTATWLSRPEYPTLWLSCRPELNFWAVVDSHCSRFPVGLGLYHSRYLHWPSSALFIYKLHTTPAHSSFFVSSSSPLFLPSPFFANSIIRHHRPFLVYS